ncbi:MAG TPA: RNase adapter RapZ [Acidimicrobiales bacterium]|nr:RNase adapter RapZ [Acidimicrobiales bacterium]
MGEIVVITGLSGAGRSLAADDLEDLGWFVIDNLPPELVPKVVELAQTPGSRVAQVALVVGTGHYQDEILPTLAWLRSTGARVRVLFLEAATDALVRRYDSSRRRHPLSGGGDHEQLVSAIERERLLLEPVKAEADIVVDTSVLNVHELRRRMRSLFGDSGETTMQTTLLSFGYKNGLPLDADLVFDCRFLPNPHWVDELRPQTGLDAPVRDYVLGQPAAGEFLDNLETLLVQLLPAYVAEGKAYLTIALGCTGGRHRSVVIAEELARRLRARGQAAAVLHRDVDKVDA